MPSNRNYFPEQDRILQVDDKRTGERQSYEFIIYHPVSVASEMVGTSAEELVMHNYPTKKSWESSRLCSFPQEIVLRLNSRSYIKFVLLRAKVNRPITDVEFYIGDGVYGNFNDTKYRKMSYARNITEEGATLKVDGIGNYLKLVFNKPSRKTQDNPFGQISLAQLKIFGKKVNHLVYFDEYAEESKDGIDSILINLGLPLNDPLSIVNDQEYEIAAVDEDTKVTIKDLLLILQRADKVKDFEIMKKIKSDIKLVYQIGNEILNQERKLVIAKSREDYDTCIQLRKKIAELKKRRDNYDVIYETSRYEKMIVMKYIII